MAKEKYSDLEKRKIEIIKREDIKQRQVFDLDQKEARQKFLNQYNEKALQKQALKEQSLEETESESQLISKVLSDQEMHLDEATKERLRLRQGRDMSHILINSKKMFGDSKTMVTVKQKVQELEDCLSTQRDAQTPMTLEEITNIENAYKLAIGECQNYLAIKTTHTRSDRYIMVRNKMLSMMEEMGRISTIKEIVKYDTSSEYAKVANGYALIFAGKLKNNGDRKPSNDNNPNIKAEENKTMDTAAMDEPARLMVGMLMQNAKREEFGGKTGDDNSNITSFLYHTLQSFPKGEYAVYLHSAFAGYKGKDLKRTFKDKKGKTAVPNTLIMLRQDAANHLTLEIGDKKVALSSAATISDYLQEKMMQNEAVFGQEFTDHCMSSLIEKVESRNTEEQDPADATMLRTGFARILKNRFGINPKDASGLSLGDVKEEMRNILNPDMKVTAVDIKAFIYSRTHRTQVVTESTKELNESLFHNYEKLEVIENKKEQINIAREEKGKILKAYQERSLQAEKRNEVWGEFETEEKKKAHADAMRETLEQQKKDLQEKKKKVQSDFEEFKKDNKTQWELKEKRDVIITNVDMWQDKVKAFQREKDTIKNAMAETSNPFKKKKLKKSSDKIDEEVKPLSKLIKNGLTELGAITVQIVEVDTKDNEVTKKNKELDKQLQEVEEKLTDLEEWIRDDAVLESQKKDMKLWDTVILGYEKQMTENKYDDHEKELRKSAVNIISSFSRIQARELNRLNALQLTHLAGVILAKEMTPDQVIDHVKKVTKRAFIATDSDEDTMINTHETIEKIKYSEKNKQSVQKQVTLLKKEQEVKKDDPNEKEWGKMERTVMNFLSDLIYSQDTWLSDENVSKPGERIRKIFQKEENIDVIAKLALNPKLLDPMLDRLPLTGDSKELKESFHSVIHEVLDTSSMEPGFVKNMLDKVKNPDSWEITRKSVIKTVIAMPKLTEKFAKIDESIDQYMNDNMHVLQKEIDDSVDSIFGKKDKKKTEQEKEKEKKLTDREKLLKMCEGNYSADKGEGLFMKTILQTYFAQVSDLDRRSMIAFALREARPKEVGKVLTEKDIKKDFGRYLSGIFKGAGPLLQKMLQGMPSDFVPEELKGAFSDVKENLLPIPEEIVKAQLFDIVERSHGGISKIEIDKALGAASVGQTFLCNIYGPTIGEKGKKVVVKILRPDAQNRMMREKNIMLDAAKKVGPGMLLTYKGRLAEIEKELDLTKEAHNVELGVVYDKTTLKDGKSDHVFAEKLNNLVEPSSTTMVIEQADGATVDKYIKTLDKEMNKVLDPILEQDEEGRHIRGDKLLKLSDDFGDTNTEEIRNKLLSELEKLTRRQQYLINFTKKWVDEGMFKSGYYHGDLHAGNIMVSDKEATIIDFGNAVQFDEKQKDNVIRMLAATVAGDPGVFEDAFCQLLSKDPEVQQVVKEKRGEMKNIIKEVLSLGNESDSGFRVGAVLARLQEIGIQIPNEVYSFNQSQMRLAQTVQSMNDRIEKIQGYLKSIPSMEKALGGATTLSDFMKNNPEKFDEIKDYTSWSLMRYYDDNYLVSDITDEKEKQFVDTILEVPQIKSVIGEQVQTVRDARLRLKNDNLTQEEKNNLEQIITNASKDLSNKIREIKDNKSTEYKDIENSLDQTYSLGSKIQNPAEPSDALIFGNFDESFENKLSVYMNEEKYGSLGKSIKEGFDKCKQLKKLISDPDASREEHDQAKMDFEKIRPVILNKLLTIQIKEISELKKDEVLKHKLTKEERLIKHKPDDFGETVGNVLMDNKWSAVFSVGAWFTVKTGLKAAFS